MDSSVDKVSAVDKESSALEPHTVQSLPTGYTSSKYLAIIITGWPSVSIMWPEINLKVG